MHSPTRAAPGTIIGGRYALRTPVGHGGMGTVWRATDTVLRREVAVKEVVLPPGLAASDADAMCERTLREARAAAGLSHPSIVQVFDVVTEDRRPWIVMEMLDARSLADLVIEDGPLAPRAVAKVGVALLGALEVAHAGGVLHRDVKPANVLITHDGRCVLTDFGVAKLPTDVQLTTPGMVLGSPHFISPERALGHRFGPPSDLFSLGVTLYTAVEGRPPFDKGDPLATMHSVVEDPPYPPERCGPLIDVLYGLMEKDPSRRWDVGMSRGFLRELLAGPLAHPSQQQMTEQYSYAPPPPPPIPMYDERPPRQVGGRAMLHTGETPTQRRHRTTMVPTISEKPKRMRLAVAAGVATVLVVTTVSWAMMRNGSESGPPAQTSNTSSPSAAPVQKVTFNGITIDAPLGWKQSKTGTYMDLKDPADSDRWLRLNVLNEKDPEKALEGAEKGTLKNLCKDGYERIKLGDVAVAGTTGSLLEFRCTPQDKQTKHGLWMIAYINGKSRHLYLQTWDATFAQDKQYFDTALASYTVE